jgi:4'-phosphopantetheinyl transferase
MNRLVTFGDFLKVQELRIWETAVPEQGMYTSIKEGTIHIWSARYSALDRNYPLLSALVSPEETLRAAGFKKGGDTRRYILRHGLLRAILEHYTYKSPEKLSFIYGRNGKPDRGPEDTFPEIRFSLSHTNEMVCLGITQKNEIGLDIVKINPRYPFSEIEEYLFTPGERKWMTQTVPERRAFQFFRIWSLKEALLKATGSDAGMMKEADVSGIITETILNGYYPLLIGKRDQQFFIDESCCGLGHHRVVVTI